MFDNFVVEDSFGDGVAEEFAAGAGGMKVVAGIDERKITFAVKKTGVIGVSQRITFGGGEVDQILKVEPDSFSFFNFIESGKMGVFDAVTENDGIGSDSGGQNNFSVGKESFDVVDDSAKTEPVAVDAGFGVAEIVVSEGFDDNNVGFLRNEAGDFFA